MQTNKKMGAGEWAAKLGQEEWLGVDWRSGAMIEAK